MPLFFSCFASLPVYQQSSFASLADSVATCALDCVRLNKNMKSGLSTKKIYTLLFFF